jgi:hypothetical protein
MRYVGAGYGISLVVIVGYAARVMTRARSLRRGAK